MRMTASADWRSAEGPPFSGRRYRSLDAETALLILPDGTVDFVWSGEGYREWFRRRFEDDCPPWDS